MNVLTSSQRLGIQSVCARQDTGTVRSGTLGFVCSADEAAGLFFVDFGHIVIGCTEDELA